MLSPEITRADYYDDPCYDYQRFWEGRQYEHAAEELALKCLLRDRHFRHALDVGGGYGRWSVLLAEYADRVTLVDPSRRQLTVASDYVRGHPRVDFRQFRADRLPFDEGAIDLVTLIRVMHHLTAPLAELREIARVLNRSGSAVIEFANSAHALNRLKYGLRRVPVPWEPVDIRSAANRHEGRAPFVNHNPGFVMKQLHDAGLGVARTLSVSNLRHPALKRTLPHGLLMRLEKTLQTALAGSYFGPSIFLLVKKA